MSKRGSGATPQAGPTGSPPANSPIEGRVGAATGRLGLKESLAESGGDRPEKPTGSVENALRLLLMFQDREFIRVSQVASDLGVARSTAHRLLALLTAYGFVSQEITTRAYGPGPRLVALGLSVARSTDILGVMHPFLEGLSQRVDETVHLLVLEGTDCRFVDSVESRQPLRVTARVGVAYPAHATAGGKALLAELSQSELRRLYPKRELQALTERTLAGRDELFAELEHVRRTGFAANRGERTAGIFAIAMAQLNSAGNPVAALAVSAPSVRLTDDRIPDIVTALRHTTGEAATHLP